MQDGEKRQVKDEKDLRSNLRKASCYTLLPFSHDQKQDTDKLLFDLTHTHTHTHTHLISCDERLVLQAVGIVILLIHLLVLFFVDLQIVR